MALSRATSFLAMNRFRCLHYFKSLDPMPQSLHHTNDSPLLEGAQEAPRVDTESPKRARRNPSTLPLTISRKKSSSPHRAGTEAALISRP
jgi:hypothetical protein